MISPYEFRGSWSGYERDVFFYNSGLNKQFSQIAYGLGVDFSDDGRAFVPFDFDGDGDLDVMFSSLQSIRLLENRTPTQNFVRIDVRSANGLDIPLGSLVQVTSNGITQQDYVKLTAGFQVQVPSTLHFGLGNNKQISKVVVTWPDGQKRTYGPIPANQHYVFSADKDTYDTIPIGQWTKQPLGVDEDLLEQQAITLDGRRRRIRDFTSPSKLTVLNFWAPWCKPCKKELPMLSKLSSRYKDETNWLGISVEEKNLKSVKKTITQFGLKYPQLIANERLLESFFGDDGNLPVPSTFVFDEGGQLIRAYLRPASRKQLRKDIETFSASTANSHLLVKIAEAKFLRGHEQEAFEAYQKALKRSPNSVNALLGLAAVMRNRSNSAEAIKYARRAIEIDIGSAYGWWLLGLSYSQGDKQESALEALEKATKLSPGATRYLYSYGDQLLSMNRFEKAKRVFSEICKLELKSTKAIMKLVRAKLQLRDQSVLSDLEAVLKLEPQHREALRIQAELKRVMTPQK